MKTNSKKSQQRTKGCKSKKYVSYEERQITAAQRSIQGSELMDNRLHESGQEALAALGESDGTVPVEVVLLRSTYRSLLQSYSRKKNWAPAKPMNKRSINTWTRVEEARKRASVTHEEFLKAQFAWFHNAFGRAPTISQLATDKAIERAREYVHGGKPPPVSNPITRDIKFEGSMAEVFKYNERMLQSLLRAQKCTRAEFYRKFVLSGEFSFDPRFLQADPVYIKVYNEHA